MKKQKKDTVRYKSKWIDAINKYQKIRFSEIEEDEEKRKSFEQTTNDFANSLDMFVNLSTLLKSNIEAATEQLNSSIDKLQKLNKFFNTHVNDK